LLRVTAATHAESRLALARTARDEIRVAITAEQNKLLVQRLIDEAVNPSNLDVLDELAEGEFAEAARRRIGPFWDSLASKKEQATSNAEHRPTASG
jgi:hypothetical protein